MPFSVQSSENFSSLSDPGRVCCKEIINQGRLLPSGLSVICQLCLKRKGDSTGAFVHVPRERKVPYGQTVMRSSYETR